MAIVYCTHNKINGKKYIGSHSNDNIKYLGSGFRLKIAVKKYGKDGDFIWNVASDDYL